MWFLLTLHQILISCPDGACVISLGSILAIVYLQGCLYSKEILNWPDRKKSEEIMREDSLTVEKQVENSSNKCQLKQWDFRSYYYSAWKAYFLTCLPSCIPQLLSDWLWNCFLFSDWHGGRESMCRFLSQLPAFLSWLCSASSWAVVHGPSWLRFLPEHQQHLQELLQAPFQPPVLFVPWMCQ